MYRYIIDKVYDGLNIREYLETFHLSKSKINRIINEKHYMLNDKNDNQNSILREGDVLLIDDIIFNEKKVNPIFQDIEVLYEDDYFIVVNKMKNMIIHSDQEEVTLDRIVAGLMVKKGFEPIPRHVYRLDKDTTGCMIYALDPLTLSSLSYKVENKELRKIYTAILEGIVLNENGTINKPIATNRHINGMMVVSKNGKPSITHYKVKTVKNGKSLIEVYLETGRTHQIRVHMSSTFFPIVGDKLYGSKINSDLMLQASSLELEHPINKKRLTIKVSQQISL